MCSVYAADHTVRFTFLQFLHTVTNQKAGVSEGLGTRLAKCTILGTPLLDD